ncbi:MAG TPA: hypothetical protein VKQ30_05870 [Ktedonobacterales bacterium]|nr:hypothetical protein [Ktedonobacterales bacterium]
MFDIETISVAESGATKALEQREKELAAFYERAKHVMESVSQNEVPEGDTLRTHQESGDTRRQLATELNSRYGGALDAAEREIRLLTTRRDRLHVLEDWSKEDPDLMRSIDEVIVNQLKASKRRQRRITFALAITSLIVGWLLSAIAPVTVIARLVGH